MQQPDPILNGAFAKPVKKEWIDISVSVHDSMTGWPGFPHVTVEKFQDLHKGDETNITVFSMPVHSGTHVDAPRHIFKNGNDITAVQFDSLIGICQVIEIEDQDSITRKELEQYPTEPGAKILFKTKNSQLDWTSKSFRRNFVFLTTDAAEYLVERKVATIGTDYICIGSRSNHRMVHSILFEAGVTVIEGLNLSAVKPGIYELYCLPLKILGADGAPARAVLREISE